MSIEQYSLGDALFYIHMNSNDKYVVYYQGWLGQDYVGTARTWDGAVGLAKAYKRRYRV